jgi:hypothetical protein
MLSKTAALLLVIVATALITGTANAAAPKGWNLTATAKAAVAQALHSAPKPLYVDTDYVEASLQEQGLRFGRNTRLTVLDIVCNGAGVAHGDRYHIFQCYITTRKYGFEQYHVTTSTSSRGPWISYEAVPY